MDALIHEARRNNNVWLLTADLGYSFIEGFAKEFPSRFVNVGVAEQNLISVACGLALCGKKVFVYSIINFLIFRALAQIRQDICAQGLDVHLIGVGAGLSYQGAGYSHYAVEDIGVLKNFSPLKIFSPADDYQTRIAMSEIFKTSLPTYIRLGKSSSSSSYPPLNDSLKYKEGKKATLFCLGESLWKILPLVKDLDVSVISVLQIYPLDGERICEAARRTSLFFVVEEHKPTGLTSSISEILMRRGIFVKLITLSLDQTLKSIEEILYDSSFDLHSYL